MKLFLLFLLLTSAVSVQASTYSCTQSGSDNTVVFSIPLEHNYSIRELNFKGQTVRVIADETVCGEVSGTDCRFSPNRIKDEDVSFSYVCKDGSSTIVQTLQIYRTGDSYYSKDHLVIRFHCNNITTSSGLYFDFRSPANRFEKCSKLD